MYVLSWWHLAEHLMASRGTQVEKPWHSLYNRPMSYDMYPIPRSELNHYRVLGMPPHAIYKLERHSILRATRRSATVVIAGRSFSCRAAVELAFRKTPGKRKKIRAEKYIGQGSGQQP